MPPVATLERKTSSSDSDDLSLGDLTRLMRNRPRETRESTDDFDHSDGAPQEKAVTMAPRVNRAGREGRRKRKGRTLRPVDGWPRSVDQFGVTWWEVAWAMERDGQR